MPKTQDRNIKCSFCGKPQEVVKKIIAGPSGVFICDECVGLCQDIIEEEIYEDEEVVEQIEMPTPAEIKKVLDEYVIRARRSKKNIVCSSLQPL
jgi:ATP-dependent Clp protease ATP-binding subunit ClpX